MRASSEARGCTMLEQPDDPRRGSQSGADQSEEILDGRTRRARTEPMRVRPMGGGIYEVDSASGATYAVDIPGGRCTCPDHTYRGVVCKHQRRVAQEIAEGRVPPPGKAFARCVTCNRELVVEETATPPHYCVDCDLEPGDFVVDENTGDLLVVAERPHGRADEMPVPNHDVTVAQYPGNRRYPDTDPVVEALYPIPSGVESQDLASQHLRRYRFPLSRLRPAGRNRAQADG